MIRLIYNEEFKEIDFSELNFKKRYAISNKGRLVSFHKDLLTDGTEINGSKSEGYRLFKYKKSIEGKIHNHGFFIYKLVAKYFLPKPTEDQKHLIHLDYVRDNDSAENLKWVTYFDFMKHYNKSPYVIKRLENQAEILKNVERGKLTATEVIRIKKTLQNPKGIIRLSRLAKQFGVSEMQIRRIKSGENWGHIEV